MDLKQEGARLEVDRENLDRSCPKKDCGHKN